MASIRHSTVATKPNRNSKEVSKNAWNDDHVITGTPDSVLSLDSLGNLSETPLTDFATGSDISGLVAESDLAAPTGAALTGFINSSASATARSVQAKLRDIISVKDFGAVGDGVTDDSVAIQNAIDAVNAAGGGQLRFPAGTYLIDGYKGAQPVWTSDEWASGGIIVRDGVELIGAGRDKTIIKNFVDDWRCVLRIRDGANVSINNLTVDGDWPAHDTIPLGTTSETAGSVRGEGIIFEGSSLVETVIDIKNVHVKNTGHYGIGIQNVAVRGGAIRNVSFENIGGDCIDLKHYIAEGWEKDLVIDGVVVMDGCGHNYVGGTGIAPHDNQACIDIGGRCIVTNVFIMGLDSFGTQLGNTGVRARPDDIAIGRSGAQGSVISNIYVKSSKLAAEGSLTLKRITGVAVNATDVTVSNVTVDGAYWGFRSYQAADNEILRGTYSNINVYNATSSDGSAWGISFDSGNRDIQATDLRAESCEIGIVLSGQRGSFNGLSATNCTTGLSAADDVYAFNTLTGIYFDGNTADTTAATIVDDYGIVVGGRNAAIVNTKNGLLTFHSIFDGNWTTSTEWLGGIRVFSTDSTGAGVGSRGSILLRPTGTSNSANRWEFAVSGTGGIDQKILTVQETGLVLSKMPSEFADDAAASAGGVAVGGLYKTGSVLKVRVA